MDNKPTLSVQATYHPYFFNVWLGRKITITITPEDVLKIDIIDGSTTTSLLELPFSDIYKVYKYSPGLIVVYTQSGKFKIDFQPRIRKLFSLIFGGLYSWSAAYSNDPWAPANNLVERFESSGVKVIHNRTVMPVVLGVIVGLIISIGSVLLIAWLISMNG